MMPLVGFLPPDDARVRGTVSAIERHLTRDAFVARYHTITDVDGLPPGEGAFLLCSFWLVDNYTLMGRHADARRMFERLLEIRSAARIVSVSPSRCASAGTHAPLVVATGSLKSRMMVAGVKPRSSAAAYTNGLNAEPG